MNTNKGNLLLVLGILLFIALACSFSASTANISDLKLGKDENVSQETSSFKPGDTIHAVATISNAPGKLRLKGRLVVEDVEGQQPGPIPRLEKTLDMDGSGTANFTFSPPAAGWPAGKYKMEVLMLNEEGEQKDQKAASFTIS